MKNLLFPLFLVCQMFLSADLFSQPLPKDFDAYVEKVLKIFNVPGVAVAIVKDGKVILAKGYGVKTIGTNDKVARRTTSQPTLRRR